jgi:ribosome maturation factor RimP
VGAPISAGPVRGVRPGSIGLSCPAQPGFTGERFFGYTLSAGHLAFQASVLETSEWAGQAHFFFLLQKGRLQVSSGGGPVQAVIERTVSGMGYELVDVEIAGRGLLRVFIDLPASAYAAPRDPDAPPLSVRVEDCEKVSHQLSHVMTVEHIDYARLEVSSPGMDRPLRRAADWERFEGEQVALRLREPLSGRRNFEGLLVREPSAAGEPARWALELPDPKAAAPRRPGAGRPATAARKRPATQATTPAEQAGGVETVRRLSFTLDEVERARLVPRIKF